MMHDQYTATDPPEHARSERAIPHDSRYCGGPSYCGWCRATLAAGTAHHLAGRYMELPPR
jgi:ferredoxin